MSPARRLLAQRRLAMLLCLATLLLRMLVPAGYMIGTEDGRVAITICSGTTSRTMMMEMPGMRGEMPGHGKSGDHGKAEMPCAFSGLSAAMTGATDPIQLAALIAFVMAVGLIGVPAATPSAPTYLRPPLRGPPAYL